MDRNQAAKTVFICYRQLQELLQYVSSSNREYAAVCHTVASCVPTYNAVLASLKECFALDPVFVARIEHLQALKTDDVWETIQKLAAEGAVLRGSAHAFIELHLSPEERKKAIGFHA